MAELTPLFMDVSGVYSGDELGLPLRDLVSEGVVKSGDLAVTERGAGINLSVDIAAGAAYVLGDTNVDRQPCYRVLNDAVVNKGITPDPTNPRKVLVVAQVTDETFAGTGRKWELVAIHGAPGAVPVEPALPASALPLALIDVTAADASIANAQITDRRVRAAFGGTLGAARTYTPIWTASGAAPSVGNGTLAGRFTEAGKRVNLDITLTAGSGTTFGTGTWFFSLPPSAPRAANAHGVAFMFDSSAAQFYPAFCRLDAGGTIALATLASPVVFVSQGAPITFQSGDVIDISLAYERA